MTGTTRAPLTFGQLSVWRSIEHLPLDTTEANLTRTWDLPPGVDVAAVREALAALEARHESLRTIYAFGGDRGIEQVVLPPSGVSVPVVTADPAATPIDEARRLASTGFALDREPAWRVALRVDDGRPTHVLACIHHLVADSEGIAILYDELSALLAGKELPDDVPTCREIAAEQGNDYWAGRTRAAVEYWRRCLADLPAQARARTATTDIRWADLFSIPALEAARRLAADLQVSLSTVVFGAFCRAVAERDGPGDIVVGQIAGNRTDARSRRLASTVVQLVPIPVRLDPGGSFAESCKALQWAALGAYRHGYFDVDALRAVTEEYGYDAAGTGFRYFFNFSDAFPKDDDGLDLGDEGWAIETHTQGRDNGFEAYFVATASSVLECRFRERSGGQRSDETAERLTASTRDLLLTFQDVLVREAAPA